jgi:hypothetical protein
MRKEKEAREAREVEEINKSRQQERAKVDND